MPHPFVWVPGGGARHASEDRVPPPSVEFPEGTVVSTLCGAEVSAEVDEVSWLWRTCRECDERTREIVGLEPLSEIERRVGRLDRDQ
ncbi:zinc finger protein [Actinopolyspora mortivallis]|uniref:zinc finger protein n=1 Tax=Actinopolyspora mortivallis TaxID=33906 RepID=UPI0003699258|nr:zinc finger protein [Actinopolyspora mortivallis]